MENAEGLVKPTPEADSLDDSRRDNLFTCKCTPSDRIHSIFLTSFKLSGSIAGEVGDLFVGVEFGFEGSKFRGGDEELYKWFLEDVAILRAPTKDGIGRFDAIDSRL